jgi:serine protease
MRTPSRIVATCATLIAAAITPIAMSGGSAAAGGSAGLWPHVPASAGHLSQGVTHYFWPRGHDAGTAAAASPGNNLVSGGGGTPGTVSTAPAVYLVFWGSQWSTSDPYASYLTNFMSGLYGSGDDWSSVSQQYCQGVAAGTVTCPSTASHVGVPSGSLVKGVWFDNALPATPVTAGVLNIPSVDQMAAEAVRAAAHFGNTAPGSNTETQYVIALPSLFVAPGEGYYCAYHSSISSNYGDVAYTNLPYLTDVGSLCGQDSVNANGTYDGVSIVEGHEFMETITDMRPATGWTDTSGEENGDKCAWISSGQGAMANLTLSTGTYAVQSTWSNAFNGGNGGCVLHNS